MNGIGSSRRPWGRIAIGVAAAVVVVLAGASPAAAHGGGDETGPANYRSEITDPGADGLSWQVLDGDGSVELTNTTGAEVIVVGYQGEPYLRFTPGGGVYRNTGSPATTTQRGPLQRRRDPARCIRGAEPNWEQVETGRTFAWHDHRAHWMSRTDPPQVAADPDRQHLIAEFQIPLLIDDSTTTRRDRWR
ncbi:MAG: hypothetical protein R2710_20985 [Acidimicrobiales bacterium]